MFVKSLAHCAAITANDLTELRELLHPDHDGIPLSYSLAHAIIRPGQRSIRHYLTGRSLID